MAETCERCQKPIVLDLAGWFFGSDDTLEDICQCPPESQPEPHAITREEADRLADELECSTAPINGQAARMIRQLRRERDEARERALELSYQVAATEAQRDEARDLLAELVDDEECRLDHHGACQTHGCSPALCVMARARSLLEDLPTVSAPPEPRP